LIKTSCYCCDEIASTVEHIPPQCLFPEQKDLPSGVDLRRNLITVPSCEKHNLQKSGDDEYLMYVLATNLPAGVIAEHHFLTKITRAIQRRPSLANRILWKATRVTIHDAQSNKLFETFAIEAEGDRLQRTLEKVALGLFLHHFGERWAAKVRVVPEFLRYIHEEQSAQWNEAIQKMCADANALFAKVPCHGDNPSIFKYQMINPTSDGPGAIRMHFYGGCSVLAFYYYVGR
jgi:hypothetical protein